MGGGERGGEGIDLFTSLFRLSAPLAPFRGNSGCLPFVRINRLRRAVNNCKGFSKISKPTARNGAYQLHFDFPL